MLDFKGKSQPCPRTGTLHSAAESAMKSKSPMSLLLSTAVAGLLLAGTAPHVAAQNATACPSLPPDADLSWNILRTDTALLCRAIRGDNGQEAFALTLSQKSPFKPDSNFREERGVLQGEKFWWYRGEIAGRPKELVRETLVKLNRDQVAHVFIRTEDPATLGRYQGIVQGLQFDGGAFAAR
jgi:hypothetical protein